jgi:hypothetical protein
MRRSQKVLEGCEPLGCKSGGSNFWKAGVRSQKPEARRKENQKNVVSASSFWILTPGF